MTLASGTRLGPYEIQSPIGAGGMGEVYKARDTRLGRDVAIKVLPASFSVNPDRLRRFEGEAKAAGILNHPNITSVYDVGSHDGAPYVVSELLVGETLRSALAGGKLAARRALDYGLQIVRGLAAAHEKGIVHRDLKPENLFVTNDGRIKILDFGLAKLTQPDASVSQATNLPTATAGTEPGVVLGTLGYMSPEQVRGKAADARSDIFSFGAILYEMLSDRRAFYGDSAADTMSAILKEDPPDLSVTNQSVSPGLERVIRHCLEKNPEQRFHSAHDLAFDLENVAGVSTPTAPRATRAWSVPGALVLGAAVLLALVAGVLLGRRIAPGAPDPPEIRALTYSGRDDQPAASPDGKTIAFSSDRDGRRRIWLKQIAGGNEVALTEGPRDSLPRFSPDGSSILFAREEGGLRALYRCPLVGGTPRRLVADSYEGDWSPDGRGIAFLRLSRVPEPVTRLGIASADGSNARIVAEYRSFLDLRRPRWTPDGRAILVVQGVQMGTRPGVIHWISSDGSERRVLSPPEARGEISSVLWSNRRMVYMQASEATSAARTVAGQVLLQRPGDPRARILLHVPNFGGTLDVLGPGRLIFEADLSTQTLREFPTSESISVAARWITQGRSSDRQPFYSPDGKRLVFASDRGGNLDIWEIALATGALRRLTDDPAEDWDPELSPDGKSLVWSSNRGGHFEIWISEADGSDPKQVTRDGVDAENPQITPDGRWITYGSTNPQRIGLWKIHPDGSGDTRLVAGPVVHPEISPDGSRVLYHVPYVAARLVTLDGKSLPFSIDLKPLRTGGRSRWFPDGRSIGFIGLDSNGRTGVFVQDFSPELADTSRTRRPLAGFDPDRETDTFGISPDGSRVVLSQLEPRSDILIAERVPDIVPPTRQK